MPRNNFKTRNFMLELYPDNSKHQSAFDFICSSDWTYCYILHHIVDLEGNDIKEGDGKPHYHLILCFENPVFASSLAKKLGLVNDFGEPDLQFIQACRSLDDSLLYLTHVKYQDKEQYSQYDIQGSKVLKNRYMSALFKYIEGKRVTVRDFFSLCKAGWINLIILLMLVLLSVGFAVAVISSSEMRNLLGR